MADPGLTRIGTGLVDLVASVVRDRAADWSAIEDHPYPESWWATEMLARTRRPGPLRCVGLDVPAKTRTPVGTRAAWLPDFLFEADDPARTLVWTELKVANLARFWTGDDMAPKNYVSARDAMGRSVRAAADVWRALTGLDLPRTEEMWARDAAKEVGLQLNMFGPQDRATLMRGAGALTDRRHVIAVLLIVHGVKPAPPALLVWSRTGPVPLATVLGSRASAAAGHAADATETVDPGWTIHAVAPRGPAPQQRGLPHACLRLRALP